MKNHAKYVELLGAILDNVENMRDTVLCLLKSTPVPTSLNSIPNQSLATHAQHFAYLAIEELGKFYLILKQYDNHLDRLSLQELGWKDHDRKIQYFLDDLIRMLNAVGGTPNWVNKTPAIIKMLREYKEGNIYINYEEGKIIKPVANRGDGTLNSFIDLLTNGISAARLAFETFKHNSVIYKK